MEDMSVHIQVCLSQRSQNSGSWKTDTLWWEEKNLWAPRLQRKEEFFQFYFKKLLSMASSQRHNPSLVGLARFVAGCTSSILEIHFHLQDNISTLLWLCILKYPEVWWSASSLAGQVTSRAQLMIFVSILATKLHKFWWSVPGLFSDELY